MAHKVEKKDSKSPDESRTFDNGKLELRTVGDVTFGYAELEPGWKWSNDVKPLVKTESCKSPHTQYHISGRLHILMDDGTEVEFGPGDVGYIPPGHDGWVVGNEVVKIIDVTGMAQYAVKK